MCLRLCQLDTLSPGGDTAPASPFVQLVDSTQVLVRVDPDAVRRMTLMHELVLVFLVVADLAGDGGS
jgi:hypothetical protein